ncbi:MAG: hypothetical protein ACXWC9_00925 [Pseudobdellovibrionaceae bacterium]
MRLAASFSMTILISIFTALSVPALAQDTQTFMKDGFKELQASLSERFKSQLITDKSCPSGSAEVVENLAEQKGKLLSAIGTMQSILNQTTAAVNARKNDSSRCGSCKQTNVVSSFAIVSPEKTILSPECENRPSETFAKDFSNAKEIQDFTQDLLKGKGSDGERLADNCPNPCAYYITTAQTLLASGDTHLTLTIQCGQPRKDSIFSAAYIFKAGMIQQWTCSR